MMAKRFLLVLCVFAAVFVCFSEASAGPEVRPSNGKLKIFILAGQSNMVGFGQLKGSPGTMEAYVKSNPKDYGHLVDKKGKPVVRNDVWIVNLSYKGKEKMGWLTTGYGASDGHIGPEYAFGFAVGDYYKDPVLLIKSAWGGRSLYHNFLSPSSADYATPKKDGDKGFQYAEVLRHVKEITGNLKKYYPRYAGKGYEIVGIGWHQGWNDRIDQKAVDVYEKNMVNFIKDIRKDLGIKKLPFVIANTGMGGWNIPTTARYKKKVEKHMAAQLAPSDAKKYPEFKGNVAGVETRSFQRSRAESPSRQDYHWMRNWETYYLIGKSMGDSMVAIVSGKGAPPPQKGPSAERGGVAPGDKTSFKGWELYVWQDGEATCYSLMTGTNRLKSPKEIVESAVRGFDAIKPKLDELKKGQSVFVHGRRLAAKPPAGSAKSVIEYCRKIGLKAG